MKDGSYKCSLSLFSGGVLLSHKYWRSHSDISLVNKLILTLFLLCLTPQPLIVLPGINTLELFMTKFSSRGLFRGLNWDTPLFKNLTTEYSCMILLVLIYMHSTYKPPTLEQHILCFLFPHTSVLCSNSNIDWRRNPSIVGNSEAACWHWIRSQKTRCLAVLFFSSHVICKSVDLPGISLLTFN